MNQDIVHQEYGKNSIFLQTQVGTQSVTGIFRCDIIDSDSQMQQVYIGVYLQPETSERITIIMLNISMCCIHFNPVFRSLCNHISPD